MTGKTGVRLALYAMTFATLSACAMGVRGTAGREVVGVSFMVTEPPAARVEVLSEAPSKEHVWIKGHYVRSGNEYSWQDGRWERPAAGFHTWVAGHWDHETRGWFFVEGHWSA